MNDGGLLNLINELRSYQCEQEWFDFKTSNNRDLGVYISALSNTATLMGRDDAYLIFGIDDKSHEVVGTDISITTGLEMKTRYQLNPSVDFNVTDLLIDNKRVVVVSIKPAIQYPTKYKRIAYIRINSSTTELSRHPDKERLLWQKLEQTSFEAQSVSVPITAIDVLAKIDYRSFFSLINQPIPIDNSHIIECLTEYKLIRKVRDKYQILGLGAILFANNLSDYDSLSEKSLRILVYPANSNTSPATLDITISKGYAITFTEILDYIKSQLPIQEIISGALRQTKPIYPIVAIREFLANSLIHQDFSIRGSRPTVEIFKNRIEISNPGTPIIKIDRFIDHKPESRNEKLASMMRLVNICEERGSGVDRAIEACEECQLPAPDIINEDNYTKVILYAQLPLSKMSTSDRLRAAYQHACLKYVSREPMTNQSFRNRLRVDEKNYAIASRIIRDAVNAGLIKPEDPNMKAKRYFRYVPYWAS